MKKNILSIILIGLLCFPIFLMAGDSVHAVSNEDIQTEYYFEETDTGFILRYELIENDKVFYYDETQENNITYTKKYIKDNDELFLIEEFKTVLDYKEDGSIIATIDNNSDNTSSTYTVLEEENILNINQDFQKLAPGPLQLDPGGGSGQRRHPIDRNYVWRHTTNGHLGFSNLTTAAITGILTTLITGGNVKGGAFAAVVAFIYNGKYRNLYYSREHYIPYGSQAGRPLWKRVLKLYYDKNRTNQLPDTKGTIYIEADILTRN